VVHSTPSNNPDPKKPYSTIRLIRDLLVVVALVWLGFEAYWGYFKLRIWMAGADAGAFWAIGMVCGFLYFYVVHKIYERLKDMPNSLKKWMAYLGFSLVLIFINPVPLSFAVWIFIPPGGFKTAGHWFFVGSAIAGGIVILLERMFAKKKPSPIPGKQ
jgi:hypothetical protein